MSARMPQVASSLARPTSEAAPRSSASPHWSPRGIWWTLVAHDLLDAVIGEIAIAPPWITSAWLATSKPVSVATAAMARSLVASGVFSSSAAAPERKIR